MKKKVNFFIIAAVGIFMISMYGCKIKNEEKKEKVLNLYIDVKDKQSLKVLNYVTEDYKKINEDSKINMIISSDTNIEDDMSSKDADIIFTSRNQLLILSQKGILSDMKSYYEKNDITNRYYNIVTSYGRYNDKMYGIPLSLYTMEILYNKNMMKTSNKDMPAAIKEMGSVFKNLTGDLKTVPVILNDGMDVNNMLASLIACNSLKVSILENICRSGSESYKNLNDMQVIFSNINYFRKSGILGKDTLESGNGNTILRFIKGEMPVIICSSNFLYEFQDMENVKAVSDYSDFLAGSGIVPVFSSCILAIPITSKNSEETEKFIKFALDDDEQKKIAERGFLTGNIKANAENKGLYGTAAWHMSNANENSIALSECLPEKLTILISYKTDKILEGKYTGTEWKEIVDEAYPK